MKKKTMRISLQISLVLFVFLLAIFTYSSFLYKIRMVDSKLEIDKTFLINALKIGDYFFITKYVAALNESGAVSFAGVLDVGSQTWIASSPSDQSKEAVDMSSFLVGFSSISFLRTLPLQMTNEPASWKLYYQIRVSYLIIVLSLGLSLIVSAVIFLFLRRALIQISFYFSKPILEMVKDINLNAGGNVKKIIFNNYKNSHSFVETEKLVEEINSMVNQILSHQDQLKEAEILRVLNDLSRQVAHDIQSPIGALKSAIAQLKEKPELAKRLLLNASSRIEEIAKDLSVEDLEASKFRFRGPPTDIIPLIKELVVEKSFAAESVLIKLSNSHDSSRVSVNPTELARALSNILNNSLDALQSETQSKTPTIQISLNKENDFIVLSVQDNGSGIPPEHINKVTNKGFTSGKLGGHGQGLSHAKSMMVSVGGQIRVESDLDKGTKVSLFFPLSSF